MNKQNLAQKLITSKLTKPTELTVGQEIYLKVDQTLTHDINAVMSYLAFEALELPRIRTKLSVSYIDHNLLQIDYKTPDDHLYLQSIAKKYGLYLSKAGNGICHTVHYSRFAKPGEFLLGGDSHTPSCGALGMLAIGAGGMDVATAMAGVPFRMKMPKVVRVQLTGQLQAGVAAKDIILEMLRRYTVNGGTGRIYEYTGAGMQTLSIPERVTIANMGAELGATTSIFPSDQRVLEFLRAQGREQDFVELLADAGCSYDEEVLINLDELEPLVACPHLPDNVTTVRAAQKVPVNQVMIGSCTNGSYADIAKAARILKGRHVHENVSLVVAVSSRQIYKQLLADGVISDLLDAGARFAELACGACCGVGVSPSSKGVSVRTFNRNFKGRSGTADAELYLVSPEVAAATAICGHLATADEVLSDLQQLKNICEPDSYPVDDSMLLPPAAEDNAVEIVRGPNIKPLPVNTPPVGDLQVQVSLKAADNVSTDDITPANAEFSSMRSNIPAIAEFAYCRHAPKFVKAAKEYQRSAIIAGENYGQGSSREHAAITVMFLGVKMIIAKSFARIHKNNLINYGVIPLVFAKAEDYLRIEQTDELCIVDCAAQLKSKRLVVKNITKNIEIEVLAELSDEEIHILLCGGQLPAIKAAIKGGEI